MKIISSHFYYAETYQTPVNELWEKGRTFVRPASVSIMGRTNVHAGRMFDMPHIRYIRWKKTKTKKNEHQKNPVDMEFFPQIQY